MTHGYCPFCSYASTNHPEQPHPDASAPHFGLQDEGLLVHDSQLRPHVEACCLPWTQHIGANCGEQKEMNTGRYPYFTLSHRLSQPVRYHLVINFTGLSLYS